MDRVTSRVGGPARDLVPAFPGVLKKAYGTKLFSLFRVRRYNLGSPPARPRQTGEIDPAERAQGRVGVHVLQ